MSEETRSGGAGQPSGGSVTEEFKVQARDLGKTINGLIHEGMVRRVQVLRKGRILIDIPLAAGVAAGAVMAIYLPWIAALTAVGALLGGCTVRVERDEPSEDA